MGLFGEKYINKKKETRQMNADMLRATNFVSDAVYIAMITNRTEMQNWGLSMPARSVHKLRMKQTVCCAGRGAWGQAPVPPRGHLDFFHLGK